MTEPASQQDTILITGCSSGIGYCTAKGLRDLGYQVFTTARQSEDIEKLKSEGFPCFQMDYRDSKSIQQTVTSVLEATNGELFALFNNGAYGQPGALEDLSRDALREQFESNVFGWHELTNLIIPVMRKQGYGRIIQNSSMLGFVSLKYRGAYNASKYALEGLTDTLRLELRGSNVFISLVEPGPITSRFRDNAFVYYKKYIEPTNSVHQLEYQKTEARLHTERDKDAPFTLPPEAVLAKVVSILESEHPKARYPVTFPTYLFQTLKRLFPTPLLDSVLNKVN